MIVRSTPRPTQTKVKHELLDKYLAIWGRIIVNGVKGKALAAREHGKPFDLHLVYVDTNAFTGRYDGELEDVTVGLSTEPVYGSAVVGVQALDRLAAWSEGVGVPIRTNTILIEKRRGNYRDLQSTLQDAGLAERVHKTRNFSALKPGEIAVVCADWTVLTNELVAYTQSPYTFALYLIDPYGPMAIPLDCIGKIVQQKHHDVIINLPYRDLHKKTGLVIKRTISPSQEEHRKHYDRMFGGTQWQAIVQQIHPAIWNDDPEEITLGEGDVAKAKEIEEKLSNLYRDALKRNDPSLLVKSIRLLFPRHDLTMYYLYLTTHNADGALKMNELIWNAGLREYRLRKRLKQVEKQAATGMMSLPGLDELIAQPQMARPRPSTEDVAAVILERVQKEVLTRQELYGILADEPFFTGEISRAVTHLKH